MHYGRAGNLRKLYASNPGPKMLSERNKYASNPGPKKLLERNKYTSNPESKKRAVSRRYAANPGAKNKFQRKWYSKHCSAILQKRRHNYYACIMARRAKRLLHHAVHRCRENAKNKLYCSKKKLRATIANKTAKRARYVITEPKLDKQERCQKHEE